MADLPSDVDTEQDRVIFIKSTAQFLVSRAQLIVNSKYTISPSQRRLPRLISN